MNKKALIYARVSQESQNAEESVSIDQQLVEMRGLCGRNGWRIMGEFVDAENYKATQQPKIGTVVNPSGERSDRPKFLEMLDIVKTGEADVVLCLRDDRLVRHPRVAVALEDALDIGDIARNGRPQIQICDATGAVLDRFTMSIKASIWREENKRRAERTKLGKIGTLKEGRWPGPYRRYGYQDQAEPGRRGRSIVINESEAAIVQKIFNLYDSGLNLRGVRKRLIAEQVPQRDVEWKRHKWCVGNLRKILVCEDYTGKATWRFGDGEEYTIPIPPIILVEQRKRVLRRLAKNKQVAIRNAKGIYLLQGIARCGECGSAISTGRRLHWYSTLADGTRRRGRRKHLKWKYQCVKAYNFDDEPHPSPKVWDGKPLDLAVWNFLVEKAIKHPEAIGQQILSRQAELQAQGDSIDSDIAKVKSELVELENARAFYQRQAARGKITEEEFDARMDETEELRQDRQAELNRLLEFRDDAARVRSGIDYAQEFLEKLQEQLPAINHPWDELEAMPENERNEILTTRREILMALVETVHIYANGDVKLEGVLDGSEGPQFEYRTLWNARRNGVARPQGEWYPALAWPRS